MDARKTQFFKVLDGRKQFTIPIYQRTYSWEITQCKQLWDDIVKVSKDDENVGHFIGSIVFIEEGEYLSSDITHLHLIDGQQRLTTILLLVSALGDAVEQKGKSEGLSKTKIQNTFLFNVDEEEENHYKLILTQSDKDTLINILEGLELSEKSSRNLVTNFEFFKEQISNSEIDLDAIYKGILKLITVEISLGKDDDAQSIFESLNSTGLELSQADLIRNYVLMGLERQEQTRIYKNYWFKIEEGFGHSEGTDIFDRFMRDYLTIKTHNLVNEKEVYTIFKKIFYNKEKTEELVKDIHYYSKFFTILSFGETKDKEIKEKIQNINNLPAIVAYPFLLQVYSDYDKKEISREVLLEILDLVESYVFRRQICAIASSSLNKTFARLYDVIKKEDYLTSFKAGLSLMDDYRRFPNDDEFQDMFQVRNVYNFKSRKFLFRKLENFERKERVNTEEYTLEHIMPQNASVPQVWRDELGENWREVHETYLHKVGNLTWTGYNPELSDKSFKEKQNMEGGFKNSPILLNDSLRTLEIWNEVEIKKRSKLLADKALKIWKHPNLSQEILSKYHPIEEEDGDEFESSSLAAKLAWATRRYLNPEKWGEPTSEDLKLLSQKNTRLGKSSEIDTIVCACSNPEDIEQVFFKEQHWHKIRIGADMKDRIKYIAIYESAPISAITCIGKVKEIKPFENSEYSELILSEKPEKINPILLPKNNPTIAPQSHKYTTKSLINRAKTLEDMFLK
jgi:uncharacterized protein with ParB-like and HNH nuclease domain